jgi:hypothetical protein
VVVLLRVDVLTVSPAAAVLRTLRGLRVPARLVTLSGLGGGGAGVDRFRFVSLHHSVYLTHQFRVPGS